MSDGSPEVESKYEWSTGAFPHPNPGTRMLLLFRPRCWRPGKESPGEGDEDGVLRLAGPVDLQTLDPGKGQRSRHALPGPADFHWLTRFDDDLQPVPALAESIDISDDGLTYTFTLRRDARFADGRDITAEDVAFSLNRALDPATTDGDASPTGRSDVSLGYCWCPRALERRSGIALRRSRHRRAHPGDRSGRAALDVPDAAGDRPRRRSSILTMSIAAINGGPIRTAAVRSWSTSFDYRVWHDARTERALYSLAKPELEEVRILLGANAFQPMNLYQTGAVDIAPVSVFSLDRALDPTSDLYADLQQSDLFAVEYLAFRTDVEPLNDPNIRKALILGFPREKVAEVSFDGRVAPAHGIHSQRNARGRRPGRSQDGNTISTLLGRRFSTRPMGRRKTFRLSRSMPMDHPIG